MLLMMKIPSVILVSYQCYICISEIGLLFRCTSIVGGPYICLKDFNNSGFSIDIYFFVSVDTRYRKYLSAI